MKSISMKQTNQTDRHYSPAHGTRRGSTLLVVIGLLAILALMGVLFYTFSAQERSSAENFAEAAVNEADPGLQADVLFNFGLEQLIKGPDYNRKNSALWGGDYPRHSMIYNMLGSDLIPFNGQGVNVVLDGSNNLDVDQDYNGTPDVNATLVQANTSPVAHGGVAGAKSHISNLPTPDVDYTSPDINSMFLAFKGYVPGPSWPGDPTDIHRVIIPSFHRPQYMRIGGSPITDPYNNAAAATRVLRPHNDHHFIHREGVGADSGSSRYSTNVFDNSGYTNRGALGIWTGHGDTEYSLDVDNDGDTIPEGVWLDLDFPPIEDPQNPGQYIIPMFSFTVYDADGLINLNTAGNMRQPNEIDLNYAPGGTFGNNTSGSGPNPFLFLSRSNQGLSSPGEINPQWALTAVPPSPAGTFLDQHRMFFGAPPAPSAWAELSNMEYFFLNYGRAQYTPGATLANGTKTDIQDLYPGRWGEPGKLYEAQRNSSSDNIYVVDASGLSFPRAGQTLVDDNADRYEGSNRSGSLQGSRAGAISFKHPLAHNGAGRSWAPGGNYRRTNLYASTGGPATWPYYMDYEIAGPSLTNYPDSVRWPSTLFYNPGSVASENYLLDDSDEIVVDMEKVQRPYDEPFGPEEMAHLQLSNNDIVNSGVTSRLSALMPLNFGTNGGLDLDRRKRFTTMSWDRKQFSKPVSDNGANSNLFPPAFSISAFRPELRALLAVGTSSDPQQRKLNLNQLLVFENTGTGSTVSYRPLTPHPGEDLNGNGVLDTAEGEDLNGNNVLDSLPATPVISATTVYPPVTPQQQEFWARYDRQRMARDLYTLLYSLNSKNATPSYMPPTEPYPEDELYQMAQFAVNVVDALDPDNVMTRFEFDSNLDDGWNLDDNPYDDTDSLPSTSVRRVVWGVEAQQLTLSEFLLVQSNDQMSDLAVTQFPDDKTDGSDKERFFTAIELRNNSPYRVPFGDNGKWMVGLEVDGAMRSYAVPKRSFVEPGDLFTLLSSNAADTFEGASGDPYSEFRIDMNGNGDFSDAGDRIIPAGNIAPANKIDIVNDLATTNTLVSVLNDSLAASAGGPGSFLSLAESNLPTATEVIIKLYRKAHLGRDTYVATGGVPVPDDDNPWVLVDEISVDKTTFDLDTDTVAAATPKLPALQSKERSEPLNKRTGELVNNSAGNIRNTIGLQNSRTTTNFSLWQPHFDRDFASPVELFSVPIVGPDTQIPNDGNLGATQSITNLITFALTDSNGQQAGSQVQVAGIKKFLSLEGVTSTAAPTADYNYWYRLFEYVEVPTRIHRQLANPLKDFRVPGKLNLNTIRHPSVLAALIDDMGSTNNVLDSSAYNTDVTNANTIPRLYDTDSNDTDPDTPLPDPPRRRDWWEEFILSRDAVDPVAGIALPGTPGSRPFRSFDFFGEPARPSSTTNRDPRENTLLRSLPIDYDNSDMSTRDDPRQLFEVADRTNHTDGPADFHTRNRILSKIMGNTTTRSNTFLVFMSVAYFEASGAGLTAHDDLVQIGDRAHGKTVHDADYRGFFVIDRSRVEEAFEPTTEKFDHWKKLVRYRHLIQSIQED